MIPSKLILETGDVFYGYSPEWMKSQCFGEVVFNTGMVGYTEVMTDPSYTGQIVVFTYPMIGNYGVESQQHWESEKIRANGIVVSELAPYYARTNNHVSLEQWCEKYDIAVITDIDTRALTKVLRNYGVVSGVITTLEKQDFQFVDINERDLVKEVTIAQPTIITEGKKELIVVDCGIKSNIINYLSAFDITIKQVPYDYDYTNESYDGVFISNGPGDPAKCTRTVEVLKKSMSLYPNKPIFGICLGSQIMGLAVDAQTYKLKFGHRAQNHPCLLEGTDRCYLTSQNHGYAVIESTLPDGWEVMFRNLNDQSVQGLKHKDLPYFSVQFHPEAGPGPVDTAWLFDDFIKML